VRVRKYFATRGGSFKPETKNLHLLYTTTPFSAKWLNCSQSAGVMSEDKQAALNEFTKENLLLKVEKSNNPCT
jgi:hypothetical protein